MNYLDLPFESIGENTIEFFKRRMPQVIGGLLCLQSLALVTHNSTGEAAQADSAPINIVVQEILPTTTTVTVIERQIGIPAEITKPVCEKSTIPWLPDTVARWHPFSREAAKKFNIPASIIDILITFESLGHPTVKSAAGAIGVMQIMPSTGDSLSKQLNIPPQDLQDPASNIYLSAKYIRNVLDSGRVDQSQGFNRETAKRIAIAYNGGMGSLDFYLANGQAKYAETRFYADHVAQAWDEQNMPTSSAYNDWMSYRGARQLQTDASVVGVPPCG